MKLLNCIIPALIISASIPLYAGESDATLTFFIGKVTILKNGNTGIPAYSGMQPGLNDIIKTARNSGAEISFNGTTFFIGENKSVNIRELSPGGHATPIFNVMKKISGSPVRSKQLTIAAVRAEKMERKFSLSGEYTISGADTSAGDDPALNRLSGLMAENNYSGVWDYYKETKTSPGDQNWFDFTGGMAGYNLCLYSDAAVIFSALSKTASDSQVKIESAFYAGLSLSASLDYSASIPYLTAYISSQPGGDHAAEALFIRGISYLKTGQDKKAREDMERIIKEFPASPVAGDAESVLKDIK